MTPILITGMHRSGTSAFARMVQALGVDLGANLLGPGGGNVYGHFEDAAFIEFHDQLIAKSFPKRAPFCEWLPLADANVVYLEEDRAAAQAIWDQHSARGGQAWKDPRTSLFLDLWLDLLPGAKLIICIRHPYQSHRSLLKRGEPFLHADYSASIAGWNVYNQRILAALSTLPKDRFVVIDVDLAFREARLLTEGIARFLGLPPNETAVGSIEPDAFTFDDDVHDALGHFGEYFPETEAIYRQLKQFDLLNPAPFTPPENLACPRGSSPETRLIEYEETYGLRDKSKRMLVRSITVDRKRTADFYQRLANVNAERDRLIDDLVKLNEHLKRRVAELENNAPPVV
jgi:hypothetical protein